MSYNIEGTIKVLTVVDLPIACSNKCNDKCNNKCSNKYKIKISKLKFYSDFFLSRMFLLALQYCCVVLYISGCLFSKTKPWTFFIVTCIQVWIVKLMYNLFQILPKAAVEVNPMSTPNFNESFFVVYNYTKLFLPRAYFAFHKFWNNLLIRNNSCCFK